MAGKLDGKVALVSGVSDGLGEARDIATAALYLSSDDARRVTGIELTVDGGLSVRP